MKIGVPKEIMEREDRVAVTPAGVEELVHEGHKVLVQNGAGEGSKISDKEYIHAGARMVKTPNDVYSAEMIVKVKEPLKKEYSMMRRGQVWFCYLHFAASQSLFKAFVKSKAVGLAYETITLESGEKCLLTPMSEVAGLMSVQVGAHFLERPSGGRGVLLSGIAGVASGHVVIIGAGVVGVSAARVAAGMGAHVVLMDINVSRLRELELSLPPNVDLIFASKESLRKEVAKAHLLVGAVLVAGARAPRVVTEAMIRGMKPGSVIVDVAIDQGGCVATSRPTHHNRPTFTKHGVIHYCVTNMPGAVPRTSTYGLTNVTIPYVQALANQGWKEACRRDPALRQGLNVVHGFTVHPGVADAFGVDLTSVEQVLK